MATLIFLPVLTAFTWTMLPVPVETNEESDHGLQACNTENKVFTAGEEIVYKFYYNWNFVWLSAGEVTFKVSDKGNEYHLQANGRTYKSYEWFYRVRDRYECYVDKVTLLPRLSIRDIQEGSYRLYDKITYDQNGRKATSLRGKTREEASASTYSIDNCMHDVLSILYYARNVEFGSMNVGAQVPVKVFMDKEVYPLKVKYLGRDDEFKVKGLGHFRTHKFSPQVVAGRVFKDDSQMVVWVSDDGNKLPLLIESPVSVGSIKAVLKSYKGLRHPLSSKIQD